MPGRLRPTLAGAALVGVVACSNTATEPLLTTVSHRPHAAEPDRPLSRDPPGLKRLAASETAPSTPNTEPRAPTLELTFVGDVIFGRYRPTGYDPIPMDGHEVFADMATALRSDVLVGNLETPLVRELPSDSPIGARFRFGASLEMARHLVDAGFTAVSLANNHWFDMRHEGVEQTPLLLEELGVMPLGRARAEPPVFRVETLSSKGWRIGFVAVTARSNAPQREDVATVPYLATPEIDDTLAPILEQARSDHDLLAVVVHWGDEYADAPSRSQVLVAHALIESGADMVIGHHPHVLQAVERYHHGIIAYSLGNFLFENTNDPPRLTGVLRLRYRAEGVSPACLEGTVFHPAYVKRMPVQHPVPATGFMGRKVKDRMRTLGKAFGTAWEDDGEDLVLPPASCPEQR